MLLYSATFPESVEGFINQHMRDPLKIKVDEKQSLENVKQFFVGVDDTTRLPCIKSLITKLKIDQCIIYCGSISTVKYLARKITQLGVSCFYIHSKMDQKLKKLNN